MGKTRGDMSEAALTRPEDARTHRAILLKRLESQRPGYPEDHKPSLDDLVFLPANLSRLVIDPYRDACNVSTDIAGKIRLELPFLAGGLDELPEEIKLALANGLARVGSAYLGRKPLPGAEVPWLQLVISGEDAPDQAAAAH